MLAGLMLLVARRVLQPSLRRTTTVMDVVMCLTLGIVPGRVSHGRVNVFDAGHDYRETVAVWLRGVLLLHPDPSLMAGVPLHTLAALALLAIWPFTPAGARVGGADRRVLAPAQTGGRPTDTGPSREHSTRSSRSAMANARTAHLAPSIFAPASVVHCGRSRVWWRDYPGAYGFDSLTSQCFQPTRPTSKPQVP
jgi:hypothetical protein